MIGDARTVELGECFECGSPGMCYYENGGKPLWMCADHAGSPLAPGEVIR